MSDLPPEWGFLGSTSRDSPTGDPGSKEEQVLVSYTDNEAPSHWIQTCSASEPSGFSDIFQILSNIHLQEPSPKAETSNDSLTRRSNFGETEFGEPSNNNNNKRRTDDLELRKCLSEGNEQLSTEVRRKEELIPKRTRSAETHNMSEKRRRSRIKEKIRSLHQLIPNSDKKDCASILDEAVGYLKTLKVQAQMMSMSTGTVYYNPYISTAGTPNMPIAQPQYSPYVTFRPGMGLVPMVPVPSPTHSSHGIMPLVQVPMEVCQSEPIQESNGIPAVGQTVTAVSLPHFDIKGKRPAFKEMGMTTSGSQEASTSGQISSNLKPGSIVHATHTVPPSSEGKDSNM